jgi:hypothetical protein
VSFIVEFLSWDETGSHQIAQASISHRKGARITVGNAVAFTARLARDFAVLSTSPCRLSWGRYGTTADRRSITTELRDQNRLA